MSCKLFSAVVLSLALCNVVTANTTLNSPFSVTTSLPGAEPNSFADNFSVFSDGCHQLQLSSSLNLYSGASTSGDWTGESRGLPSLIGSFGQPEPNSAWPLFLSNVDFGQGSGTHWSIVITSIPEPSSLGLLAVGAAGLLIFRRRARS